MVMVIAVVGAYARVVGVAMSGGIASADCASGGVADALNSAFHLVHDERHPDRLLVA
jgi:hypothetical protein